MRPPSRSRLQPTPAAPTRSPHSSSRTKTVHSATPILPSYNYCGNPAHKASECNIPSWISFVIIVGKRDIKNLFVLLSFRDGSNSNYHDKICQHLPLSLNQKLRHFNLPFRLCPPRVILIRMLRRRSTMLTRGRCFKPMQFKFKSYKMNSNH
jgi:hypothetical protein